ncbi:MAG: glutathione S-transferase family protein [Alphaproteobacteria bacterium]|nr:glutathione S-transferase family protein [Alphaproteobacteria bacterium]
MITLYHFGDTFGFDPSPFCLKMETYLRLAGHPFQKKRGDLRKAPKRQLPVIEDDGRIVADSRFIIEYLKAKYGNPLDGHLSPAELANLHAWQRMIEESLYWTIVYSRWIDDDGWKVFRPLVFGFLPGPLRSLIPPLVRRRVARTLNGQGTLRHSKEEIYGLGLRDVDALAGLLGDRPYMFGDKPTSLDASAAGSLINILHAPLETPLKVGTAKYTNLAAYADRIRERLKG